MLLREHFLYLYPMRYPIVLLMFMVASITVFGQQKVFKTVNAIGVNKIDFNIDKVFDLQLTTSKTDDIHLEVQMEGEHSDQLVVSATRKGDVITISCDYHSAFKNFNDKLSAHKVVSAKMIVSVPEKKRVYIKSEIANTQVKGRYDNMIIELKSGNFIGRDFYGNATINTYNGAIALETDFAQVEAISRNGKIDSQNITPGPYKISLKSVNGRIAVTKPR